MSGMILRSVRLVIQICLALGLEGFPCLRWPPGQGPPGRLKSGAKNPTLRVDANIHRDSQHHSSSQARDKAKSSTVGSPITDAVLKQSDPSWPTASMTRGWASYSSLDRTFSLASSKLQVSFALEPGVPWKTVLCSRGLLC